MIVISNYTENGRYPAMAQRLGKSCEQFGLKYLIGRMNDAGDWLKCDHRKVTFILEMLIKFRRTVVWMDCDCEIIKLPELLFGGGYDFAAYNWRADAANPRGYPLEPERLMVSGGVLAFSYTAPAIELLVRWASETSRFPQAESSDVVLDAAFNGAGVPGRWLWLPSSYNRMAKLFPDVAPVINHDWQNMAHRESK